MNNNKLKAIYLEVVRVHLLSAQLNAGLARLYSLFGHEALAMDFDKDYEDDLAKAREYIDKIKLLKGE